MNIIYSLVFVKANVEQTSKTPRGWGRCGRGAEELGEGGNRAGHAENIFPEPSIDAVLTDGALTNPSLAFIAVRPDEEDL